MTSHWQNRGQKVGDTVHPSRSHIWCSLKENDFYYELIFPQQFWCFLSEMVVGHVFLVFKWPYLKEHVLQAPALNVPLTKRFVTKHFKPFTFITVNQLVLNVKGQYKFTGIHQKNVLFIFYTVKGLFLVIVICYYQYVSPRLRLYE